MNRSTAARIGIAGAVAGAGLAVGGIAIASADEGTGTPTSSDVRPSGVRGGPGGHGGIGEYAETLAEELGVREATVKRALLAVHRDLRSERAADGSTPSRPTEAERAERRAALAKALADELDVSEAKVTAALAVVEKQVEADREDRRAQVRTHLVSRLDEAVEDGTLTEADKTSVLKAFDAEILGGPGGPGGGAPPE